MLVTKEMDYAIRIIRGLSDGKLHTVSELVREQMIPQQFTYKIIKKLSNAEIIQIFRGAAGGCQLIVDLKEVTLYDLILAIEGNLEISACMKAGHECQWRKCHKQCIAHNQLRGIQGKLNQELKLHSLHSIIFGD